MEGGSEGESEEGREGLCEVRGSFDNVKISLFPSHLCPNWLL